MTTMDSCLALAHQHGIAIGPRTAIFSPCQLREGRLSFPFIFNCYEQLMLQVGMRD